MSGGKRMAEPEGFDWSQIPFKKIAIIAIVVAVILLIIAFSVHIVNKKSESSHEVKDAALIAKAISSVLSGDNSE